MIKELTRQNARPAARPARHHAAARPPDMEGEAVHRALAMAKVAGAPMLIYHVTASEAVRELAAATSRGQIAFGEVPHVPDARPAAWTTRDGTALDLGPPLRDERAPRALWAGLATACSTSSRPITDAAALRAEDGSVTSPPGTSGIEVRLPLVYTFGVRAGHFSLHRWVERCCMQPAELFGLTRKGRIAPGYDADIVVFDPERTSSSARILHSNIDHTTYEGVDAGVSRCHDQPGRGDRPGRNARGRARPRALRRARPRPPLAAAGPPARGLELAIRLLVTGGCGFVGSNIVRAWLRGDAAAQRGCARHLRARRRGHRSGSPDVAARARASCRPISRDADRAGRRVVARDDHPRRARGDDRPRPRVGAVGSAPRSSTSTSAAPSTCSNGRAHCPRSSGSCTSAPAASTATRRPHRPTGPQPEDGPVQPARALPDLEARLRGDRAALRGALRASTSGSRA